MWIKGGKHAPATGLAHDSGQLGKRIWSTIVYTSGRTTNRIARDNAPLGVDLTIDEVIVIASITASADSTKSALNWMVRRRVGNKPSLAAVVSSGDV